MNFATAIKNYREVNKLTQNEIAKKLSVDRTTIIKWERGTIPRYDKLKYVCDTLGIVCDIYDAMGYQAITDELNEKTPVFPYTMDYPEDVDFKKISKSDIVISKGNEELATLTREDYDKVKSITQEIFESLINTHKK